MIRWLVACAMLVSTSGAVFAAPDTGDLFDLCPPDEGMRLLVESLDPAAIRGDLTEEQIRESPFPETPSGGTASTTPRQTRRSTSPVNVGFFLKLERKPFSILLDRVWHTVGPCLISACHSGEKSGHGGPAVQAKGVVISSFPP